jgi:transposase
MTYTTAEKREIIRMVEQADVSVSCVLRELDIAHSTFYDWYGKHLRGELDRTACTRKKTWNRIPDEVRSHVVEVALDKPDLTPRELAWYITDNEGYFISESSVLRILKERDLITSPNYILISASEKFKHPTRWINEMWQTDFTYLHVVGWGWYYLSTVLDDYSRYIIAWKLCTNMATEDVTATLDLAHERTGVQRAKVCQRTRLLSDSHFTGYLSNRAATFDQPQHFHPEFIGEFITLFSHESLLSV